MGRNVTNRDLLNKIEELKEEIEKRIPPVIIVPYPYYPPTLPYYPPYYPTITYTVSSGNGVVTYD